ncbi:kunitz-type protease inhibitor 2 [Podargus strigoides]
MAAGRVVPLPLLLFLATAAASAPRPGPGEAPLLGLCALPQAVGRCRASIPRWWFNGSAGACQPFVYGGCGGNGNNFPGEPECRRSCGHRRGHVPKDPEDTSASSYAELCAAPPVTGPCRASLARWYWHNGTCREFLYGGCGGNRNNHGSRAECERRCGTSADHTEFFSPKALALGVLLALLAALLLGHVAAVAFQRWGRKKVLAPPGEDKESLVRNTDMI